MDQSNDPIGITETPVPTLSGNEQAFAIASIVLGLLGMCLTLFAGVCGAPFPIIGLVLGYLGMKDPEQKTLSIAGLVINGLTILAFCALVVIMGGLMVMGPVIGNVFSEVNQSIAP